MSIDKVGIMAIDPGGETGLAQAILPARSKNSIHAIIKQDMKKSSSCTISGDWQDQARHIALLWRRFTRDNFERGARSFLCIESFTPRPGIPLSGSQALYSVQVASALQGYRLGSADMWEITVNRPVTQRSCEIYWQTPAQAKGFMTDERLKRAGAWVKGKPHERDAWRHLILRYATFLTKGPGD